MFVEGLVRLCFFDPTLQETMALSKPKFKHINVLKDEVLGAGAYGTVYKAKCDDLLCAAKSLHQAILYQSGLQAEYSGSPVSRFEREIDLLSSYHHPNIVQFLGVYEDSDTKQPVLLMELLDQSLTMYLAGTSQQIPYYLQVNICHDVALALSFLHHNRIFHRDMSSNNILMLGDRAKVTDFGMAIATTKVISNRMTKCPGTEVYMPPEAVIGNPRYDAKIDCFSFGVLVIQILTKKFPNPGERQKLADDDEENFLSTYIRVPEVERRKNHIDLIHPKHALLSVSLDCLNDIDVKRPSAQQLCERIAALKDSSEYAKSKEILSDKVVAQRSGGIQADISQISSKELENLIFQGQELEKLRSLLDNERKKHLSEISEANSQIYQLENTNAEQVHEIEHLKKCLGGAVSDRESLQEKLETLQLDRNPLRLDQSQVHKPLRTHSGGTLNWMEGAKAPSECRISKGYSVVKGDVIYVSSFSNKISAYNSSNESWSILPECPTSEFAMVSINGNLTIVGGCSIQMSYSSCLYTYYEDDTDKQCWNDDYPPMHTKRKAAAAMCTQSVLIVAGGEGEGGYVLTKVEVLDISTRVWNSTVSIPSGRKNASLVTCGHCLYLVGGKNNYNKECTTIYACSLGVLLPMRQPDTLFKHVAGAVDPLRYWARIQDIPVTQTTSISFGGQLYVIGGKNSDGQTVRSVHMYDLSTNVWQLTGRMVTNRYSCVAAVLQDNRLIVFGGQTDGEIHLNTTETASQDSTSSIRI